MLDPLPVMVTHPPAMKVGNEKLEHGTLEVQNGSEVFTLEHNVPIIFSLAPPI